MKFEFCMVAANFEPMCFERVKIRIVPRISFDDKRNGTIPKVAYPKYLHSFFILNLPIILFSNKISTVIFF